MEKHMKKSVRTLGTTLAIIVIFSDFVFADKAEDLENLKECWLKGAKAAQEQFNLEKDFLSFIENQLKDPEVVAFQFLTSGPDAIFAPLIGAPDEFNFWQQKNKYVFEWYQSPYSGEAHKWKDPGFVKSKAEAVCQSFYPDLAGFCASGFMKTQDYLHSFYQLNREPVQKLSESMLKNPKLNLVEEAQKEKWEVGSDLQRTALMLGGYYYHPK